MKSAAMNIKEKEIGSREAWLRIYSKNPFACTVRLYAFEGAIQ